MHVDKIASIFQLYARATAKKLKSFENFAELTQSFFLKLLIDL